MQATPSITASGDGTADVTTENKPNGHIPAEEMTSKDYYFDSYAHFGIHEVCWDIQEWWLLTAVNVMAASLLVLPYFSYLQAKYLYFILGKAFYTVKNWYSCDI